MGCAREEELGFKRTHGERVTWDAGGPGVQRKWRGASGVPRTQGVAGCTRLMRAPA